MENENLVTEEVTENVEQTTEEIVEVQENGQELVEGEELKETEPPKGKYYTNEELNKILNERYQRGKIVGSKIAKREYEKLENVLKQGLEVDDVNEATDKLTEFYKEQGVEIHDNYYSDDDLSVLAQKDAEEIINDGYEAVDSELRRLTDLGVENMTKREKVMFEKLHANHQYEKDLKELASIGVEANVVESDEFKNFAKNLNPNLSMKEKYEFYEKFKPKPKVEQIGSMTNNNSSDNGVKDFYTFEEANKFSKEDFDKNPKLFEAVEKSMQKWK